MLSIVAEASPFQHLVAEAGNHIDEMVVGMGKAALVPGTVAGGLDDVTSSVKLAKDIANTPNKNYKSRYFPEKEDTTPAYPEEKKKPAEDNPWMLPD